MASEPRRTSSGDGFARFVIDPLRAGLQVTGAAFVTLATVFVVAEHQGQAGLVLWIALCLASVALIAVFGYPTRPRGALAFIGRAFGASAWGALFTVAFISFVTERASGFERSIGWRVFLWLVGALLIVAGVWPRRTDDASEGPPTSRDVAGALPVVVVAALTSAPLFREEWASLAFRGIRRAPDALALAVGGTTGFAIAVGAVATVFLVRARASRPFAFVLVPPTVVVVIGLVVERALMRPALADSALAARPIDERAGGLATAIAGACPGWILALLVGAALYTCGAIAVGVHARTKTHDVDAGARPLVAFVVGTILLVAVPIAGLVFLRRTVGRTEVMSTWVALVPSAAGVVGVFLAARARAASDAIVAASFAAVGVLAIAFVLAIGELASIATVDPDVSMTIAALVEREERKIVYATLVMLVPLAAALAVVLRPSEVRPALPIVLPLLVTFALGSSAVHVATRAPVVALASLWSRELPAGFSPANAGGYACESLATSDLVVVGPWSVTRGGKELAKSTELDRDDGCAALVLELERGAKVADVRVAFDTTTAWSRVDCLARALASPSLRDPKASHVVRRKPKCALTAVTATGAENAAPYPQCTTLHVAGPECAPPASVTPVAVTRSHVYVVDGDGRIASSPIAEIDPRVRSSGGAPALLVAAAPAARFADVVGLPGALADHGRGGGALETWIASPAVAAPATPASPAPNAGARVTVSTSARAASWLDDAALGASVAQVDAGLTSCASLGKGIPASRAFGARLLVGADGAVARVWLDAPALPVAVGACMARVLEDVRFAPPPTETFVFANVAVRVVRPRVSLDGIDPGPIVTPSERVKILAAIRVAEAPILACFESALARGAVRVGGAVPVRMQVSHGKVPLAFAEKPFDLKVAECALVAVRALSMPTSISGDYGARFTVKMIAPNDR